MKTETFNVTDMHCPACVMRLESLEDTLEGIRQITANYKKQTMQVEFDDTRINSNQIKKAVEDLGYTIN
jgi:copper ion binding protein